MRHHVIIVNCLLKSLEFHHVKDRGEDLLLDDRCIRRNSHNGGEHVVTFSGCNNFTSVKDLTSLLFNCFDAIDIVLNSLLVVERPKQSVLVKRVPHPCGHLRVSLDKSLYETIVDFLVEIESPQSCAPLASCAYRCENCALKSKVEVAVRHDDVGVVSAKFEDGPSESRMNFLADASAYSCRACERDKRNSLVLNDRVANIRTITDRKSVV